MPFTSFFQSSHHKNRNGDVPVAIAAERLLHPSPEELSSSIPTPTSASVIPPPPPVSGSVPGIDIAIIPLYQRCPLHFTCFDTPTQIMSS